MSKPKLYLTKKAWKRFNYDLQMNLLKKFDVIITNHYTKTEILRRMLNSFNKKNLDAGISQFKDGMTEFSKEMEKLHTSMDDGKRIDLDKQFWGKRSNTDVW